MSKAETAAVTMATPKHDKKKGIVGSSSSLSFQKFVKWDELKKMSADIPHYNGLTKCPWTAQCDPSTSPHRSLPNSRAETSNSILDSVLDYVGNTPMIRLSRFAEHHGLECELVAKCEFFSAGGSVKDRIGKRMVEEAELDGKLQPGATLIEPTSGNTGVGLALAAAVKGYQMLITLPEKMSLEKVNMMKALGAEILRTPTEAAWNSPDSHLGLAMKLQKMIPHSVVLDQYQNPANPLAHYEWTAEEILSQCDHRVDMIVVSAGTGGTVTGIGRKLKEKLPNCTVVGVDPKGSILAQPDELNEERRNVPYFVEGIGYDFIPTTLDRNVVDEWVKSDDRESFLLARQLIRLEGLLCGGSSGAAMAGVLRMAKRLKKGQRCVVVLPDSSRNYMSKFVSTDWMLQHEFISVEEALRSASHGGLGEVEKEEEELYTSSEGIGLEQQAQTHTGLWKGKTVADLQLMHAITVHRNQGLDVVASLMQRFGIDQVPVCGDDDDEVLGVVTLGNLAACVESGKLSMTMPAEKAMFKHFRWVSKDCRLEAVSRLLDVHPFLLVREKEDTQRVSALVSRIDLITAMPTASRSTQTSSFAMPPLATPFRSA